MTDKKSKSTRESMSEIADGTNGLCYAVAAISSILVISCHNQGRIADALEQLNRDRVQIPSRDVIGDSQTGKFYNINDQRVYLETDGTSVGYYVKERR